MVMHIPDKDPDRILFCKEEEAPAIASEEAEKWKLLIVDDEEEVHNVTKFLLKNKQFDGKGISLISAFSGEQGKRVIETEPDIAVILLDVVMEREDAGLQLVKHIRDVLKNRAVGIVLRTGQPGQAPEEKVITEFDINDYKEKTELTAQKLWTTIISALRSYRDIKTIETNKLGLERIIQNSASIFQLQSMKNFADTVLTQLGDLLNLDEKSVYNSCFAFKDSENKIHFLACNDNKLGKSLPPNIISSEIVKKYTLDCFYRKTTSYNDTFFTEYFKSKSGVEIVIYFNGLKKIDQWDRYLIEIFWSNVCIAFENIFLCQEIESTQKEIIFTLGEISETRSKETGQHVKRVAEYSKLISIKYGLKEEEAELIKLASSMHDIGKVGIPDSILNKPGKLTKEEYEQIKKHTIYGYDTLKYSNKDIINAAAIIALQHHERYDGLGYPHGLSGEGIHLYGRITAAADVFDALINDRIYKKAWDKDKILEYYEQEKGKQFDPKIAEIVLRYFNEFDAINKKYGDTRTTKGFL